MSRLASLSVLLLSLTIHSLLSPEPGSDLWFYYSFEEKGIPPIVFLRFDNLFYLLLELSNGLVGVKTFISVVSSVALVLFCRAVYDIGKGNISVVFILFLVPLISYLSGIRSFVATSLALQAWSLLRRDRKLGFLFSVLLALWFHVSVLPAIAMILLLESRYSFLFVGSILLLLLLSFVDVSFYITKIESYTSVNNDIAVKAWSSNSGRVSYMLQYMWFLPIILLLKPRDRSTILLILLLNMFSMDALLRTSYFLKPISLSLVRVRLFIVKFLILVSFLVQLIILRDLF